MTNADSDEETAPLVHHDDHKSHQSSPVSSRMRVSSFAQPTKSPSLVSLPSQAGIQTPQSNSQSIKKCSLPPPPAYDIHTKEMTTFENLHKPNSMTLVVCVFRPEEDVRLSHEQGESFLIQMDDGDTVLKLKEEIYESDGSIHPDHMILLNSDGLELQNDFRCFELPRKIVGSRPSTPRSSSSLSAATPSTKTSASEVTPNDAAIDIHVWMHRRMERVSSRRVSVNPNAVGLARVEKSLSQYEEKFGARSIEAQQIQESIERQRAIRGDKEIKAAEANLNLKNSLFVFDECDVTIRSGVLKREDMLGAKLKVRMEKFIAETAVTLYAESQELGDAFGRNVAGETFNSKAEAAVAVAVARDQLRQEHVKHVVVGAVVYLVFMAIFTAVVLMTRGGTFYVSESLRTTLQGQPSLGNCFVDITTVSDWWDWMEKTFIPGIYSSRGYPGITLPNGGALWGVNYVVGRVRLRQVRGFGGSCPVNNVFSKFLLCYEPYKSEVEERRPYGIQKSFKWLPAEQTGSLAFIGSDATMYPGSGYVVDLPSGRNDSLAILQFLNHQGWIDEETRLVLAQVPIYLANRNVWCVVTLASVFRFSGNVDVISQYQVFQLNLYSNADDYARAALEAILYIMVFCYIVNEVIKWKKGGWFYWTDVWAIMDWINFAAFAVVLSLRIVNIVLSITSTVCVNCDAYVNLESIAFWRDRENDINAINCFIVYVKAFQYMRITVDMGQFATLFSRSMKSLFVLVLSLVVVLFGYAQAGFLAWGSTAPAFQDLPTSFVTMFRILTGDYPYHVWPNNVFTSAYGSIYFISFVIFVFFIAINMFITIISYDLFMIKTTMDERKGNETELEVRVIRMMSDRHTQKLGEVLVELKNFEKKSSNMDADGDGTVSANELETVMKEFSLVMAAFGVTSAEQLLTRFDSNGDGVLDEHELQGLKAAIKAKIEELVYTGGDLDLDELEQADDSKYGFGKGEQGPSLAAKNFALKQKYRMMEDDVVVKSEFDDDDDLNAEHDGGEGEGVSLLMHAR